VESPADADSSGAVGAGTRPTTPNNELRMTAAVSSTLRITHTVERRAIW
jgi:hypothetical protein